MEREQRRDRKESRRLFDVARENLEKILESPNEEIYEEYAEFLRDFRPRFSLSEEEESAVRLSLVEDPAEIERLDNEPVEYGYRNVVLREDGSMGSPMADRLGKKGAAKRPTSPFKFGAWERSDENPDLATDDGKIDLLKPKGFGGVGGVDYNPYIHIRPTTLNKQFKQAWERPDLVYIRTAYPASELSGGYHAEKAKLPVGKHPWNGGELILSRWDKPVEIVPWEEVADEWEREFKDRGVEFDIVPPKLLPILMERGVEILPPHKNMGKACNDAYKEKVLGEKGGLMNDQKRSFINVIKALYKKGKEYASKLYSNSYFDVVDTPAFMKSLGLTGDKFTIRYGVISRHFGKDENHDLPESVWEQLPNALQTPFAITKYYTDTKKKIQKGYRLYTTLRLPDGSYVVVSAEVKNAGKAIEVNAINTVFGRNAISPVHDELIYTSEKITPEQQALLNRNNPHQYPVARELSAGKGTTDSSNTQGKSKKSSPLSEDERVIYTANNVLDPKALEEKYPSELPNKYYHHSTNKFGKQPFDEREGKRETLKITGRLTTDKVDVLVVDNPNSSNEIPHITLATAEGVKPVESNSELQKHRDEIVPLDDTVETEFRNNLAGGRGVKLSLSEEEEDAFDRRYLLSEDEQREQQESENFKNWFGDWENDPENASKVVDKDGRPLVVYHGTNSDLNIFQRKKGIRWVVGFPMEVEAQGYFFSDDKDLAQSFANSRVRNRGGKARVMPVYLDMKRPADLSVLTGESEELFYKIAGFWPAVTLGYESLDKWWQMVDEEDINIPERLKELGYDGIIFAEEIDADGAATKRSYFVIDPAQVKSATENNGGFDRENPDIRYSLDDIETDVTDAEAALRDGLVGVLRGAGIEVVTDEAEGQRVLEALDEKDGKTRFFRTADGEVYGFVKDGKIYLDPRVATSETAVHEYHHLWSEALEAANPAAWERLKGELLGDEDLKGWVKSLYPEIEDENELAHEVFGHFGGRRGAERLRAEQERMERENKDGVFGLARIAAPVEIACEGYIGVVIPKELLDPKNGTHRFHLHEVALQENLLGEEFKTGIITGSKQGDVAKLLKEIVTASILRQKKIEYCRKRQPCRSAFAQQAGHLRVSYPACLTRAMYIRASRNHDSIFF